MSRYTVAYGTLIDSSYEPLLDALADFPIFDEAHREELKKKIYNRFRFREIGFETPALFAHYFGATLYEIMPQYNELYKTAALDYDILSDVDYTETGTGHAEGESTQTSESTGTNSGTSSGTSASTHAHSDTPQGSFNFSSVEANHYLSDADRTEDSSSGTSSGSSSTEAETSGSSTTDTTTSRRVRGKMGGGSYAALIEDYRRQIVNIDKLICDELEICFMGVY